MAEVIFRREDIRPISEEARKRIAAIRDEDIDYSDIPQLDDSFLEGAVRGRFYRPIKQSVTLRIDADVLAWFKAKGKGYQTRINEVLRNSMLSQSMLHA